MLVNPRPKRSEYVRFNRKHSLSLLNRFQWKYTAIISSIIFISSLVCAGPLVFFLHQNYEIFSKIAYENSPQLVQHLEREKIWLGGFLVAAILGVVACGTFIGYKITNRIIGPLLVLQNHLRTVTRGNWSAREIFVRDNDEFRDLISSYNYFYKCLQQITRDDLQKLESMKISTSNHVTYSAWTELIKSKYEQVLTADEIEEMAEKEVARLSRDQASPDPVSDFSASHDPSRDSLHAS